MKTKIIKNIQFVQTRCATFVETWHAASLLAALLLCPIVLSAQNGVTVSNLAVNAGTVTFDVRWDKNTMPPEATTWSDSVWVFVDYNNNGVMARLPLLPGATLTATSPGGEVIEEFGNNKGVWVHGNAKDPSNSSGSFSATVKLLFNAATNVAGACAYASNYPPVGEYTSATNISFKGTPPYDLVFKSGNTLSINSNLYVMPEALESFTDKTGAPGRLGCIPLPAYDLKVSAAGFCAGGSGVTFALSGTQSGRAYLLYKDGSTLKATLPGTGGAATFTGAFNDPGVYTARTKEEAPYCTVSMNGSHPVVSNSLPVKPVISKPDDECLNSGNNIVFTASGYSGSLTWVSDGGGSENGNQVTFSSSATGTKTVVARAARTYTNAPTCYSADVTQSATVYALPAVATSSGASRCGNGTVTLSATASSGALIDWYAAASGGTALLSGNNAYTTPSLNTNTTYYAEARNTATGCVSARTAVLATINVVPGVPTMGGGGTQCGGSLNITATAGANGNGIRWTDNNSTTSPRSVSTTGTYYAVTTSTAGCESGTAPVSVTINAVPNITRAGGDASQTVNQNTAISAITYTASNATGISLSSGSLPAGVNGTPNGVAFTISGTPSDAGTFNYSVTATHTNGCASTAFSGAITVNAVATTPPNAASTQTWTYGTQTWSDRIVAAPSNCYNKTSLSTTTYVNVEYRIKDGRYYYTWNCAAQNHTTFCPDPWRIPDQSDAYTLSTTINGVSLLNAWGLGGRAVGSNIEDDKTNGYVWTKTSHSSYTGYAYMLGWGGEYISSQQNPQYSGMQVRCVK